MEYWFLDHGDSAYCTLLRTIWTMVEKIWTDKNVLEYVLG